MNKVPARWTDDCQGKKDFDGILVSLSTRYWPRGGGYSLLTPDRQWLENDTRPQIRPSAKASVYWGSMEDEFYDDAVLLAETEVEADTEDEVKALIEKWVAEQYERIGHALRREFASQGPATQREGEG